MTYLWILTIDTYDKGTVVYPCGNVERVKKELKEYGLNDKEIKKLDKQGRIIFGEEDRPSNAVLEMMRVLV